ncbi:hypothetical protein ACVXG7_08430 [Enterobacter hormaechei]
MMDVSEITTTAPRFIPILPLHADYWRAYFQRQMGPQLHIITILVICMLLAAILQVRSWF